MNIAKVPKGEIRKHAAWGLAICLGGITILCAWQLYSTVGNFAGARKEAVQEWASKSPARANFAASYDAECEQGTVVKKEDAKRDIVPLSIAQCAMQLASKDVPAIETESLGVAMEAALDRVEIPAPLAWVGL